MKRYRFAIFICISNISVCASPSLSICKDFRFFLAYWWRGKRLIDPIDYFEQRTICVGLLFHFFHFFILFLCRGERNTWPRVLATRGETSHKQKQRGALVRLSGSWGPTVTWLYPSVFITLFILRVN